MSKLKKALSVVISLLLLLQVGLPALASAESIDVDALIGVEIKMTMDAGSDALTIPDSLVIQMKPASGEPDNPMPEGSAGGVYEKTFENAGTTTLSMKYHALGVYHYEISQLVPNPHPSANAYDKTVYSLTVYVLREDEEIIVRYALRNAAEPEGEKYTGITFENHYGQTHVTAAKVWDDDDDRDGRRADVKLVLKGTYNTGDGIPHTVTVKDPEKTIAKDAAEADSKVTWTELPMKYRSWPITYTVREDGEADGKIDMNGAEYTVTTKGDAATGFTVTNKYEPEKTSVTVQKVWVDGENGSNTRPAKIVMTLSRGGVTVELSESNNWTATVDGLDKYEDHGKEIEYTWTEETIPGYVTPPEQVTSGDTTTFTNRLEQELIEISGTKTWVDGGRTHDNAKEITLTLTRTSAKAGSTAELVTATPSWKDNTYTYSSLEKYDAEGYAYTYDVVEAQVKGYEEPVKDGYSFTNPKVPITLAKTVTKIERDGESVEDLTKAKAGDIITYTVTVTNAGKSVIPAGIKVTDTMTRTLEDGTEAAPVVTDLETTRDLAAGESEELSYTYTVQENDGKLTNVAVSKDPDDTPPPPVVVPIVRDLTVAKVWSDNDDLLKTRPESITVTLLADGEAVRTVTLNEENKWTATAENLPVLTDDDKPIAYTWSEAEIEGYTLTSTAASGNTTTLTNTLDDIAAPGAIITINIGECYE